MITTLKTNVLRKQYEYGCIDLKYLIHLVEERKLNKENFHSITNFNYDKLKEIRG